jgi:hypothetical protein
MNNRSSIQISLLALLAILRGYTPPAIAEITKEIKIYSKPEGAEVYSPQGTRNVLLGKTPYSFNAEFHSEVSVIRLILKKNPFKDSVIELNVRQTQVQVALEPQEYSMNPVHQSDSLLLKLQKGMNPTINQVIPTFLESEKGADFELKRPVAINAINGSVFILLDLFLTGKISNDSNTISKENCDVLSKELWQKLCIGLFLPLMNMARSFSDISGMTIRVGLYEHHHRFSVDRQIKETVEWECEPGIQNELRMQLDGSYRWVPIYSPCARRVPITIRQTELNPRANMSRGQVFVFYFLPLAARKSGVSSQLLYDNTGILITNSMGNNLKQTDGFPLELAAEFDKVNPESNR